MASVGMFNGKSTYTLLGTETYIESDLVQPPGNEREFWRGLEAFCASIDTAGITVTPTAYYCFGHDVFGGSHTLVDNTSSENANFTSSAAYECRMYKQSHWTPCEGYKIRFSFSTSTAGAVLTASASSK